MNLEFRQMAEILRNRYQDEILQILFFGSRVRGDAAADSDYDCILVFRKVSDDLKRNLDRLSSEWLSEKGIVFSWVALSEGDLQRFRFEPFLRNAMREGLAA